MKLQKLDKVLTVRQAFQKAFLLKKCLNKNFCSSRLKRKTKKSQSYTYNNLLLTSLLVKWTCIHHLRWCLSNEILPSGQF